MYCLSRLSRSLCILTLGRTLCRRLNSTLKEKEYRHAVTLHESCINVHKSEWFAEPAATPMLPMQIPTGTLREHRSFRNIKCTKRRLSISSDLLFFVMGLQASPPFSDQDESTLLVLLPKRLCDRVDLVVYKYPLGSSLKTKTTNQPSSPMSLFQKSQCHLRAVSTMTPWYPEPSLLQHRSCPPLAPSHCGDLCSDLCQRDEQGLSYE